MKEQYRNYEISDEKKEEIEDLAKKYAKKIMFKLTNIQVPQDPELKEKERQLAQSIFENGMSIVKTIHLDMLKSDIENLEKSISKQEKTIEVLFKD